MSLVMLLLLLGVMIAAATAIAIDMFINAI